MLLDTEKISPFTVVTQPKPMGQGLQKYLRFRGVDLDVYEGEILMLV